MIGEFNTTIQTDRLAGLGAFVAAAETGSFARAAQRLHLTRSAVAKSIARLENRLGTRLFQRTTRSLRLTDDGQAFYERCVRALAELDAGQAELDAGRNKPTGRLRVSAPTILGRLVVAPVLLQLARRYPQLSVDASFTDRVADLAEDGVDLAVRSGQLADSAGMVARRLGAQTMVICASPAYLERHGKPQGPSALDGHLAILYARGGNTVPWSFVDAQGRITHVTPPHRLRFDDMEAMAAAAIDGMGLVRLPGWLAQAYLHKGALVQACSEPHPFSYDLHLVWTQTKYLPLRMRVLIDALMESVPPILARCNTPATAR